MKTSKANIIDLYMVLIVESFLGQGLIKAHIIVKVNLSLVHAPLSNIFKTLAHPELNQSTIM